MQTERFVMSLQTQWCCRITVTAKWGAHRNVGPPEHRRRVPERLACVVATRISSRAHCHGVRLCSLPRTSGRPLSRFGPFTLLAYFSGLRSLFDDDSRPARSLNAPPIAAAAPCTASCPALAAAAPVSAPASTASAIRLPAPSCMARAFPVLPLPPRPARRSKRGLRICSGRKSAYPRLTRTATSVRRKNGMVKGGS